MFVVLYGVWGPWQLIETTTIGDGVYNMKYPNLTSFWGSVSRPLTPAVFPYQALCL